MSNNTKLNDVASKDDADRGEVNDSRPRKFSVDPIYNNTVIVGELGMYLLVLLFNVGSSTTNSPSCLTLLYLTGEGLEDPAHAPVVRDPADVVRQDDEPIETVDGTASVNMFAALAEDADAEAKIVEDTFNGEKDIAKDDAFLDNSTQPGADSMRLDKLGLSDAYKGDNADDISSSSASASSNSPGANRADSELKNPGSADRSFDMISKDEQQTGQDVVPDKPAQQADMGATFPAPAGPSYDDRHSGKQRSGDVDRTAQASTFAGDKASRAMGALRGEEQEPLLPEGAKHDSYGATPQDIQTSGALPM